jgi:hypothetical protein
VYDRYHIDCVAASIKMIVQISPTSLPMQLNLIVMYHTTKMMIACHQTCC